MILPVKLLQKIEVLQAIKKMYKDELIISINESEPIKNKTIKDINSFCRLRKDKDIKYKVLGDIRNLYRLEKKKSTAFCSHATFNGICHSMKDPLN